MKGEYAKTLKSLGIRIRDLLKKIEQDPLPKGLDSRLHRLAKREQDKSDQSESQNPKSSD
jgi:hypothetical protein